MNIIIETNRLYLGIYYQNIINKALDQFYQILSLNLTCPLILQTFNTFVGATNQALTGMF